MDDLISRQAAIDEMNGLPKWIDSDHGVCLDYSDVICVLGDTEKLPSAQPEPLTDKEQRIFLAAMGREMKVCQEVDRNYTREPYEDSLVRVCREIERKVKGALWTT